MLLKVGTQVSNRPVYCSTFPPRWGGKIIKGFGEREGKERRKKEKKKKIWGKYNFWQ